MYHNMMQHARHATGNRATPSPPITTAAAVMLLHGCIHTKTNTSHSIPDVVAVRFKRLDLVHGVVVVHPHKKVICTCYNPLLARHKLGRAYCVSENGRCAGNVLLLLPPITRHPQHHTRHFCDLKGLDHALCVHHVRCWQPRYGNTPHHASPST